MKKYVVFLLILFLCLVSCERSNGSAYSTSKSSDVLNAATSAISSFGISVATGTSKLLNSAKVAIVDTAESIHDHYVEWKDPYMAYTKIEVGSTTDQTKTSNFTYNIPVGEPYLLYIETNIINNGILKADKIIDMDVKLPLTKVLEVSLEQSSGDPDVDYDFINKSQTYHFRIRSKDKDKAVPVRIRFLCTPLEAGSSRISVNYDDNVSEIWDVFTTLRYSNR